MSEERQLNSSVSTLRVPPHSIAAEQATLGGIMLDNSRHAEVSGFLAPDDFYRQEHKIIYEAMNVLAAQCKPIDAVTLAEFLGEQKKLDDVGGMRYLGSIASDTPSSSNAKTYAKLVRKHALTRRVIHTATEIADKGFRGDDATTLLDDAQSAFIAIGNEQTSNKTHSLASMLKPAIERIEALFEDRVEPAISTGFADLDKSLVGFFNGDLIIIAGRPSMGKTTLAMNMASAVASKDGPVMVFSLEMPKEKLFDRWVCATAGIDHGRIRKGKLNDDEWPKLTMAVAKGKETQIYINDCGGLSISQVRSMARRQHQITPLKMVVVDYLQLMAGDKSSGTRNDEVSTISRGLKALAKELNVPVIALSQLNRGLESRSNKRPMMSDLRESGAIEQDADVILFVYREEVYDENTPAKGVAECIIGKQRDGELKTTYLTFQGNFCRFVSFFGVPSYSAPKNESYSGFSFSRKKGGDE